ncbi:sensor histidine kinase [Yersinia enterocolitica]|uniref:tetrathionate respiration histidine kinase TtrS n=1 Tax=Yersinia enterocolitica TaxID=630 RepID=UPI0029B4E443|nr:PhnD/SsuA/transferrin family substrate-binding protein [Yersinia enterocolitica]EKN4137888.1 PhnD/SsuA/transferrin family substrate-binding protein [Yersinia enterocolitica]EKN5134800.1 sensor histidine kinase [Yersinia enterocolitica]EKN6102507.1 sensor histidine kinase [Yersinia enterocolitica]HDM8301337.1 PhnD/SsuA/transferrin family substrate-binding protein [Yersinia enterocolitica]
MYFRVLAVMLFGCISAVHAHDWTIGVLALRGDAQAQAHWQPLVDNLNQQLPEQHFQLLPLELHAMKNAVAQNRIDFLLTNPAQYVQIDSHFPLRWLVSLRSSHEPDGTSRNVIGSVILVRADSDIHSPLGLTGKRVGAVSPEAFGGYLLGYKALRDAGLQPEQDFKLNFSGFPVDALIYLLRDRAISAAIVPTCLLEDMQAEGLVHARDFRPLLAKQATIPCLTSTELYPNWSFAALSHVPDQLADNVTRILLNPTDSKTPQWGAPSSTSQVETLLRSVNQHPQQPYFWQQILDWAQQHRLLIAAIALILLLLGANHIWVAFLVRRRSRQLEQLHQQLRIKEGALEQAQRLSILGEMASGFAHELNQPLSAIQHYADGCAIRLQREQADHPLLPILGQISQQAQRGADTIANLRLWAGKSPTSGRATVNQPLPELLLHLWQLLGAEQHQPPCQLHTDIDPQIALHLPPTLLDQVLCNLITNSLQAGACQLWFSAHQQANAVTLTLQDDAGGLTSEQLSQPFAPFRTSKSEGLGLGLVICQRLINSQGGTLTLRNQVAANGHMGLHVIVTLPLNPSKELSFVTDSLG